MSKQFVIVGGVAGGASAAARLRRNCEDANIILLERGEYISFANCGLPYYIGGSIRERSNLMVQTPEAMRSRFQIDVRTKSEAIAINREKKTVTVRSPEGEYELSYDKLILSPGATPLRPPVPGIDSKRVYTVWNIPDTDNVTAFIKTYQVRSAVVVGGGFVGVEMAENLRERGMDVTIVEMIDQVMVGLDFDMAQYIHKEMNDHGVSLRLGAGLNKIEDKSDHCTLTLSNGQTLDAELVILAAGVRPNNKLAQDAGLAIGPRGHIVTNAYMQTSDPDIFAVGDAVQVTDFNTKTQTAVPLAGPANKQGRIAADNVCGKKVPYGGTQGTSIAKVFDLTLAFTGLNEKALLKSGAKLHQDYEVVYGHNSNHAGYYPASSPLHLKLLYHPQSGKLLGAQAVGRDGTDKRIDVLAACIRLGGAVSDLTQLELAYAPPFNTAKDPVNFAGYMAENQMDNMVELVNWNEITQLSPDEYQLIDVRTPAELAEGKVPGSILIPVDEIRQHLDQVDPKRTAVLYCKAGLRSYIAARILLQNGFKVKSMTGGFTTYKIAHYECK